MAIDKTDKPLSTLFSELTNETVDLVRQEVALARAEMSKKISTAQTGFISVAIGAAVLMAGLFIILLAVVNMVAMLLPPDLAPWLAPLIVGACVALIGYIMLKGGSNKLQPHNLVPERTMNSFKRDRGLVEEKAR